MATVEQFDYTKSYITDSEFDQCRLLMEQEFPESSDKTPWELLSKTTDVGDVTLFRRPLGNTGLYQYFVKGYLKGVTAEVAYQVLSVDIDYRKKWDSYAIAIDPIDNVEGSTCIYWSCKFPWPLSNRDYLFYRKGMHDEKSDVYLTVSKAGKNEKKPEHKDFVRVDIFGAMMVMKNVNGNCEFRLFQYDDMKGSIPKTIVNWAIGSGLPTYLKQIHTACLKYPTKS